jgi:hypothetical protein
MQNPSHLSLRENNILVSFDVGSLFTKVDHGMVNITQKQITAADLPQNLSSLKKTVSTPPFSHTRGNSTKKSKRSPQDLHYPHSWPTYL